MIKPGHLPRLDPRTIDASLDRAIRAIPPLWPLSSSVAVNPFLGQAPETLAQASERLARIADVSLTMPRAWYRERMGAGAITQDDLAAAWSNAPPALRPSDLSALRQAIASDRPKSQPLPTVAQLAASISGQDWPGLVAERFGVWAAGYFDNGQALWPAPQGKGAYAAWRSFATHDLTPEIAGVAGFARHVADAPESAMAAICRCAETLGLRQQGLDSYFHQLLLTQSGWAQFARYRLWEAELSGGSDRTLADFLAIHLLWEEALFIQYARQIVIAWSNICWHHAQPSSATSEAVLDAILQNALELGSQRRLAQSLAHLGLASPSGRPSVQAAFCIDVRSEVFRRALESLDPDIQTKGFAGFFGLAVAHRSAASDIEERRLPVLLNPAFCTHAPEDSALLRIRARTLRALGRFQMAAISSFAFVEGAGPLYAGKLLRDALGLPVRANSLTPAPQPDPALDPRTRVETAATILRAMSFTDNFAPLVLLLGHGANVVNNPHATALHCGACGGYPGDVNSRLLAGLLNDPVVRSGLADKAIPIPADTVFVAGLHDTTTDRVTLFDSDGHKIDWQKIVPIKDLLEKAGAIARRERAQRFPGTNAKQLAKRSQDWSQTRPEWGLAGCSAFIAAPRTRTRGKNLRGRVFLHDYDWQKDEGFKILELILTAPVVVASWISLQYYGSTVAPRIFGAGNKLLHNVTGGIGVVEGNGGPLRGGLPWQSLHDGAHLVHEPLRLTVCVEAPRAAMADILARHGNLRELFENKWLQLFALDDRGQMAWRYAGKGEWAAFDGTPARCEAA